MLNKLNFADGLSAGLVLLATLGTIAFNALASTGYINRTTPDAVSDKFPTVMTPAGWGFTIWLVIYLGALLFSIYQLLPRNIGRFRPVRSLYIVSCVLNCAWIWFWHFEQIAICLVIIIALAGVLMLMLRSFHRAADGSGPFFTKTVFGIYAGWVTAATLVNCAVFLKYMGAGFSTTVWNLTGVFFLLLAAALAVVVRLKLQNYLYPLAIAWAATAIAIKQSGNTAIVVASSVCVIVCLVMAVSFVMDQKSTTT